MDNAGIISQERVKQFGEVFTPDTIVNDMLNLVDEQLDTELEKYISTTYLEPACGDGQFLIRILYRKMKLINELYNNGVIASNIISLLLIKSLSSIYAVDIQADNVMWSRRRLKALALGEKIWTFDINTNKPVEIQLKLELENKEQLIPVINSILKRNIIVGNTLEPMNLVFTDYKFMADTVDIEKGFLDDCEVLHTGKNTKHYLDIPHFEYYMQDPLADIDSDINTSCLEVRYNKVSVVAELTKVSADKTKKVTMPMFGMNNL